MSDQLKPFRVGVYGAGQIVEDCHLPALAALPGVSIAWVTDRDREKAKRLASMYRTTANELTIAHAALADIDVCLVAIPFGARAEILARCAEAGVATYVEKPFAQTRADHDALCEAYPTHKLAVGYQRRFYHGSLLAKSLLEAGMFGPVVSVSAAIGSYSMKGGEGRYHADARLSGGGIVMELGVHVLDLVAFVLDANRVKTKMVRGIVERGLDHHVTFEGSLHHDETDVPVTAVVSRLEPVLNGVTLNFERGSLRFGVEATDRVRFRDTIPGRGERYVIDSNLTRQKFRPAQSSAEGFRAIWQSFLDGVRNVRVNPASAVTSRVTTDWIEAIYAGLPHD